MATLTSRERMSRAIILVLCCLAAASVRAEQEPLDCVIEPHLLVEVSSSEVGVLGTVHVDEADLVREGDVLAELDADVERAALALSRARAQATGEIELAQRDHEFNTRTRERTDTLYSKRVVSAQNLDEVRTAEDVAGLRLQAAAEKRHQAELEATRDELVLARRIVRSPITGVVVERYKTAGEYVDGTPIVQLAQLDPLRVEIVAPIAMYGTIAIGRRATIVPELEMEGEFVATVTSIDPVVDAATATFGVRLSLPNPQRRLPPGLRCTLVLLPQTEPVDDETASAPDAAGQRAEAFVRASASPMPPREEDTAPSPESSAPIHTDDANPSSTPAVAPPPTDDHAAQAPPPTHAKVSSTPCTTLGPIGTEQAATKLAEALTASDTRFERRRAGDPEIETWIVVSRVVSADSTLALLETEGVSDFRRLTQGQWKGHISFGTYRVKRWANDRLHAMQALGLEVELRPRSKRSPLWLDLLDTPRGKGLPADVAALVEGDAALDVRSIPCTRLASR